MSANQPGIERVVTHGTFSLDGGNWEVDNNIWVVGDDSEVIVIDAAHDATGGHDAGSHDAADAGLPGFDAGLPALDAGFPPPFDAGFTPFDATLPPFDAGLFDVNFPPFPDAGLPPFDAGLFDVNFPPFPDAAAFFDASSFFDAGSTVSGTRDAGRDH